MDIKQQIAAEYLAGNCTERDLAAKYGFGKGSIHRWISEYRLKHQIIRPLRPGCGQVVDVTLPPMKAEETTKEELLKEVTALQQQLEQERLRVKLLNTMIDIAEKELQVPIRKKSGTRQSNK